MFTSNLLIDKLDLNKKIGRNALYPSLTIVAELMEKRYHGNILVLFEISFL